MDSMMDSGMMWGMGLNGGLIIIVLFSPPRHWSNTFSSAARNECALGVRTALLRSNIKLLVGERPSPIAV
jgi:hypothetical protein